MSQIAVTVLCLFLSFLSLSFADKPTAYEGLQRFNFPIGLLPKGVLSYDLVEKTGEFRAYLNGACSFSLEGSYDLRYKTTISGYISENKITNLSGVSVKKLDSRNGQFLHLVIRHCSCTTYCELRWSMSITKTTNHTQVPNSWLIS
ncbi:hypothetical protein Nepgr_029654 [Nepenthes gracilis]|uniref:Uncharacterized protein n=1 Tax=Nepenthes gracilis TaxID=150966 RepID=A0AAD3Y5Q7_NEPGR|nr:hypothetical protein Nepgr_029654 [Nepenthes gracilis]